MFKLILLTGLCVLSACAPKTGGECNFRKTVYGKTLKHDTIPVELFIAKDFPADYTEHLLEAVKEINRDREYLKISTGSFSKTKNGYNEIFLVNPWVQHERSFLAVTRAWWSVNSIVENDMLVNVQDFNYRSDGKSFKSLMVHELLHVLGMKHDDSDPESIMYPYTLVSQREYMTEKEYKNLECAYGK